MSKTLKPIVHHRDHEHGGADVVLIAWSDCETTPTPGYDGYYMDAVITADWTGGAAIEDPPVAVAGTFAHGPTTPGFWNVATGASGMNCVATSGSWQIHLASTVTHHGSAVDVVVNFAQSFGGGAVGVEIFRLHMTDGQTAPLNYTATIDLAAGTAVALPVLHDNPGSIYVDVAWHSTVNGTMTFTEL